MRCSGCKRATLGSSPPIATSSMRGSSRWRPAAPRRTPPTAWRPLERQEADRRPGGYDAVPARDEHECVRREGPRDHVRVLTGERLEQDTLRLDPDAGAHELVTRLVPRQVDGRATRQKSRLRPERSLQREERRPDEELEADE